MRLTLRTLLAYLDDTLEPSQAKLIGQKVAESDTAQELMARIKQVTRRRRLTTPPPTGPGGKIDANTIAEYLDNVLSPEQLAEVEEVCLASDVHLAEIAASHQILTLVLGEPALVPPTAKQRMYGLVKGPEAIPFRKPPAPRRSEGELGEEHRELDDSLRLGLPAFPRSSRSHRLALVGGGLVAAILLALAIWQLVRPLTGPEKPDGGTAIANAKDKQNPGDENKDKDISKKAPGENGAEKKDREPVDKKSPDANGKGKESDKKGKEKDKEPDKEEVPAPNRLPADPPDRRQAVVGEFQPLPDPKEPSILLQAQGDRADWKRLDVNRSEVYSGRALVSLPGAKSQVRLKSGVLLTLWGYLPELWPFPPLLESVVEIHQHGKLDLDLTLHRGRVLLRNPRTDRPARVRLRFENPTDPKGKGEHFDLTIHEKGSEVVVDRWTFMPFTEPFFKKPDDPNRVGPTAMLFLIVMSGEAYFSYQDLTYRLEAPGRKAQSVIVWDSMKGLAGPYPLDKDKLPNNLSSNPPVPPGMDIRLRADMLRARDDLSADLSGKNVDVALPEAVTGANAAKARLAVRSFAAIDDLPGLLEALIQEDPMDPKKFVDVRQSAIQALMSWISYYRDGEYKLYDVLKKKYQPGQAETFMELLHNTYHSPQAKARPETYDVLIQYLNHDLLGVRELAAWHLYVLVPAGREIFYAAVAPANVRQAAQARWHKLIPAGKLPPPPKEPPAK